MSNIGHLIRQIAHGPNNDPIKIYMAQVLTDDECATTYNYQVDRNICFDSENLIVAVKVLTDTSSDSGNDVPTIYPYVRLMAGVADGPYNIPTQGSNVIIGVMNWLDPFIIQFSAVSLYNNTAKSTDNLSSLLELSNDQGDVISISANNNSSGTIISGSETRQQKDTINFYVTDGMSITFDTNGSFTPHISGPNTTEYLQDKDKIQLIKQLGIGLTVGTKLEASNTAGSLSDIATKIESNLNDINNQLTNLVTLLTTSWAAGSFSSGASAYSAGVGTIVTNLATITSNLAILSTEIIGVLGS
jgi:hypothetical protein